jgi:hypothetical protein
MPVLHRQPEVADSTGEGEALCLAPSGLTTQPGRRGVRGGGAWGRAREQTHAREDPWIAAP